MVGHDVETSIIGLGVGLEIQNDGRLDSNETHILASKPRRTSRHSSSSSSSSCTASTTHPTSLPLPPVAFPYSLFHSTTYHIQFRIPLLPSISILILATITTIYTWTTRAVLWVLGLGAVVVVGGIRIWVGEDEKREKRKISGKKGKKERENRDDKKGLLSPLNLNPSSPKSTNDAPLTSSALDPISQTPTVPSPTEDVALPVSSQQQQQQPNSQDSLQSLALKSLKKLIEESEVVDGMIKDGLGVLGEMEYG